MKYLISILLFCTFQITVFAQNTSLHFVDKENQSIPYVTVYDSTNNLYALSDLDGALSLKTKSYHLHLERIGYQAMDTFLILNPTDKVVEISLQNDANLMDDVVIKAQKIEKRKMKIKSFGDYNDRKGGEFVFRDKTKLGYAVNDLPYTNHLRYLRSVKFKLKKPRLLRKNDFVIELKIYPISKYNTIENTPLNYEPIFIKASTLRNSNEIVINQTIEIPENGVFISLELPDFFDNKEKTGIRFIISNHEEKCNEYLLNGATPLWDSNTLNDKNQCRPDEFPNGKMMYSRYNFGITYFE